MAKATLPDGRVLQFPDSMSDAEIRNQIRNMYSQPEPVASKGIEYDPRDLSLSTIGKNAAVRSWENLKSGATDLLPSMYYSATGDEEAALRQMEEHKAKMAAVEEAHPTAYGSYKDVNDWRSGLGFLTEKVGEELPLVPTFMVPGGIGARVGRGLAGRAVEKELAERAAARGLTGEAATDYAEKLAGRGATEALTEQAMQKAGTRGIEAGVGTAAAGVNVPETYENIYEETGQLRPGLALAYGGVKSALDTMFPAHILKALTPAGRDLLAAKIAQKSDLLPISAKRAFLQEAGKNMALEGVTEGTQDFIDTLAAHAAGSKEDIFSPKHIDSWINSAIAGGIGAGFVGAPGAAMQGIQQRDARQAEIDKRAESIEVPPEEIPGVAPSTPIDAQKQAFLDYETQERRPRALGTQMDMFPALKRYAETQEPREPVAAREEIGTGPDFRTPDVPMQSDMFNEPTNLGETEQQDLFPAEKMAAELQSVRGERAPTIADTYAGPPQGQLEISPVLTSEALLGTGLKPQSLYYRSLVGKDLSTKEGLEDARKTITAVRSNPLLSDSTKAGIEDLVNTHANQQPMFGPRGGINKEAEGGRRGVSGIAPRGFGTSPTVPVQPTGEKTTGGVGLPDEVRLGTPAPPPTQPTSGTEEQSGALTGEELALPPTQAEATEPTTPKGDIKLKAKGDLQAGHYDIKKFLTGRGESAQKDNPYILKDVLQNFIDTTPSSDLHNVAKKLLKIPSVAKVPVRYVGGRDDKTLGEYHPESGKVSVYDGAGWHTVLHEAIHAATVKGYAVDKQLRSAIDDLYNRVKAHAKQDGMSKEYGFQSPLEFMSEAFSNLEFQNYLRSIDFTQNQTFWDKLVNTIKGFLQRLNLSPREINTALDAAFGIGEVAIARTAEESEVSLTPEEMTAAGIEGTATLAHTIPPTVNLGSKSGPFQAARGIDKAIDSVPFFGPKQTSALSAAVDKATDVVRSALLGSLPTNALVDMAKDKFPAGMAEAYHQAIQNQDGYLHGLLKKSIEPVMNKFRTAMKAAPRQRDLYNEIVNNSTKEQIDPTDPDAIKNANKFSMGYLEFNADGTEKAYKLEYFDTDAQRKAAIKAYNQGRPSTERAFAAKDPDAASVEAAKELKRQFNELKDPWQDLYKAMRNVNSAMLKEFKESLCERIDEADNLDDTSRIVLKKNILTRLAEHGVIAPYFTLGREGDYWLAAEVPNDNGVYEGFVTATPDSLSRGKLTADLRNRVYQHEIAKNLQGGMPKQAAHDAAIKTAMQRVREYSQLRDVNYRTMPAGSVINDILGIIEKKKPAQAAGESDAAYREKTKRFAEIEHDIMQMVINSLPETAFVKALQKRKNTAGNLDDAVSVFEKKTRGNARQIANLRYKPKIMGVLKAMGEHTNMLGRGQEEVRDPTTGEVTQKEVLPQDNRLQEQYLHEFSQHANVILHPTPKTISKIVKTAVFGGTLGFNVSSGLIELSNLPMIVYPFLSAEYGMGPTRKAMGLAAKVVKSSGSSYTIASMGSEDTSDVKKETIKSMWSLANYGPDSKFGKKYATLIDVASRSGQLNRSPLYENLLTSARTTLLDKFNAMSGWMLHTTGRYNREVTILAAYELELARLKKKGITGKEAEERAANKAVTTTEATNGSVAASSAGRIAQSSIGSVVYMYKRFGATQLYMQARTLYNAYKNPPVREQGESDADYRKRVKEHRDNAKMLKDRFWGLTAATAVMSGLQGLPMFGIAAMLYNLFKDEDDEDFNMVARRAMGDLLYNGPVEYMTGLATASRTGLSNLIIKEPRSSGEYASFSQSLMDSIGGPFPSMVDRFQRGVSMIAGGNVERGIENLVPVSVANAMKGIRYFTSGEAETLRGDTIYGDIDSGHAFAQILGFTPSEVAKRQEFNAKQKGLSTVEGNKDSNIKGRYYKAFRENDYEGMQEAKDMLVEFGAKHPALGYTPDTVDKVLADSVKLHEGHTKKMVMGKEYPKKHLPEVMEAIEDLDIDPNE